MRKLVLLGLIGLICLFGGISIAAANGDDEDDDGQDDLDPQDGVVEGIRDSGGQHYDDHPDTRDDEKGETAPNESQNRHHRDDGRGRHRPLPTLKHDMANCCRSPRDRDPRPHPA